MTGPTPGDTNRRALASVSKMFGLAPGPAEEALIGIATGVAMERRACTTVRSARSCDTAQRNHLTVYEVAERVIADRNCR